MPVLPPAGPPADAREVVAGRLSELFSIPATAIHLRDLQPEALEALDGFRLYELTLDAFSRPDLLASASPRRWRFLIREKDQGVAEVDVVRGGGGDPSRVVAVHRGVRAAAFHAALELAEALPQVRERHFELRALECPGLHLVAIWLHGDREDLILPVSPNRNGLINGRVYSEAELRDTLADRAAQILSLREVGDPRLGG